MACLAAHFFGARRSIELGEVFQVGEVFQHTFSRCSFAGNFACKFACCWETLGRKEKARSASSLGTDQKQLQHFLRSRQTVEIRVRRLATAATVGKLFLSDSLGPLVLLSMSPSVFRSICPSVRKSIRPLEPIGNPPPRYGTRGRGSWIGSSSLSPSVLALRRHYID
jgi:hypothetical protein